MIDYLTLVEAGEIAGVEPDTLRQAIVAGRLAGEKRAGAWFVRRDDLNAYLERRRAYYPKRLTPATGVGNG